MTGLAVAGVFALALGGASAASSFAPLAFVLLAQGHANLRARFVRVPIIRHTGRSSA